ncbi:hypothetical protein ACJ4V0_20465 [Phreatobacter sp. HK31-P]
MYFFGAPPPEWLKIFMNDFTWRIFGDGEIEPDSDNRLEEFIVENSIPNGSVIYLHSPGGSLEGGMKLGRLIRSHRLQACVGQKGVWTAHGQWEVLPGHCMSAAAIALLGGEFRFVGDGNFYGVHRFVLRGDDKNVAKAQVLSAQIVEYIKSMDVDTELFALAAETSFDDILTIPEETLVRLNVVNNGYKRPIWTIESRPSCLYLKGERETVFGLGKFLIVFPEVGSVFLHVIFDAGSNVDDVLTMGADSILLDGVSYRADGRRLSITSHGSMINATYAIDNDFIEKLKQAKTVGFALQHFYGAAVFCGFDLMPFEEGAAKLQGLLDIYHRAGPLAR